MRRFVIERELPEIGSAAREDLKAAAQKSNATLKEIGRWLPALEKKPGVLERCYELFAGHFEPALTPSLSSISSTLNEVALQDPRAKEVAAAAIVEKII